MCLAYSLAVSYRMNFGPIIDELGRGLVWLGEYSMKLRLSSFAIRKPSIELCNDARKSIEVAMPLRVE